jgi:hypothetical protein
MDSTTSEPTSQPIHSRPLPEEVEKRYTEWRRHFKFWRRFNLWVGTAGTALSAVAATDIGHLSPYFAALAAVCLAVLGFAHAERNYLQYVGAWRVLDNARNHYRYGDTFTVKHLLDAVQKGEKLIAEFEPPERESGGT